MRVIGPAVLISSIAADAREVMEVFHEEKLRELDAAIEQAIAWKRCPGGVLRLERSGVVYQKAYGQRALSPSQEMMTVDTIFDVASLTKVMATAPAIMKLLETGALELDTKIHGHFGELHGGGMESITVRQLLTHTSGFRASLPKEAVWQGLDGALQEIAKEVLQSAPGTAFCYSDINFVLLGELVQRVSGKSLDQFCTGEIFRPLKMRETMFCPSPEFTARIAPTTVEGETVIRGTVHDPTAQRLGGVAGHAGLFSTAEDAGRLARMILQGGELDGARILKTETVAMMTAPQTPRDLAVVRGFGWDIDSPFSAPRGMVFPKTGFGHTGWTGCSLWIDRDSKTSVIFLSNRNHPTEAGNVVELRKTIGTLAAEAIRRQ